MITKLNYIRKEIYSIDEFLKNVNLCHTKKDIIILDGDPIKLGSDRYKLFKFKGISCVNCGIEGKFFAKERTNTKKPQLDESYHMNLYAINEEGEEVLMTKDHIKPKILGGKDSLNNYHTMCQPCNHMKGKKYKNNMNKIEINKDNIKFANATLNFTHDYTNVKIGTIMINRKGENYEVTKIGNDECGRKTYWHNDICLCIQYNAPHNMLSKPPFYAYEFLINYK